MIAGLPQGPMGAVVFVGTVVVIGVLVMSIVPTLSWIDRWRAKRERQQADERDLLSKLEALEAGGDLFKRKRGRPVGRKNKSKAA